MFGRLQRTAFFCLRAFDKSVFGSSPLLSGATRLKLEDERKRESPELRIQALGLLLSNSRRNEQGERRTGEG